MVSKLLISNKRDEKISSKREDSCRREMSNPYKLLVLTIGLLLCLQLVAASSVTRSFSSTTVHPGDSLDVTLNVVVDGGEDTYLIDEIYPSTSWTVTNDGSGDDESNPPHIFWVVWSGATSTSYTYTLTVPSTLGTYDFDGEYGFEGSVVEDILGDSQVEIVDPNPSTPDPIKINEFVSNSIHEWIELYNPTGSSVDLTEYTIEDNTGNPVALSGIIAAGDYLVLEKGTDFTFALNNDGDIILLKMGSQEVDKVAYGDYDDGNLGDNADTPESEKSTGRLPNGQDTDVDNVDFSRFDIPTKDAENTLIVPDPEDDLMVNYVRGKIMINGIDAIAGTTYNLEVLTGDNTGVYSGAVDNGNVPVSLTGNGYFDTGDRVEFNTGDSFKITVPGYECEANGNFLNGGNGDLDTEIGLAILNCQPPNNAPVLDPIGSKQVNELELLEFTINATDLDGDNIDYYANNLPNGASFVGQQFSWTPTVSDAGSYTIEFVASDTEDEDTEDVVINVINVNQEPVLDTIPDQIINEDTSEQITLSASDDDTGLIYSVISEDVGEVDCQISGEVLTMNPAENWNGDAECEVEVSDGDLTDSQVINIQVDPVNDLPEFIGTLPNVIMDEDTTFQYVDLLDSSGAGYFLDPDSTLDLEVEGNLNIDIQVVDGVVSITPDPDWVGTRDVVFKASEQGLNGVYSNAVTIEVLDVNEPPEFNPLICNNNVDEDSDEESCQLSATDEESDSFEFSISEEDNLDCRVVGSSLYYAPSPDFNGQASCTIRVSDNYGYNEEVLIVDVNPINDAPEIVSFEPNTAVYLYNENPQLFLITPIDIDGDVIDTAWFVESGTQIDNVSSGNTFTFGEPYIGSDGTYLVKAIVTDYLENVEKAWTVVVGDISDFTCEEVNAYDCNEEQICNGDLLGVYDTDSCCSVACSPKPPEFSDVEDRCEAIASEIIVDIQKPDDGDDFMLGDEIDIKVEVKNSLDDDYDFDVEVYLYDIDEDDILEEYKDSIELDENDRDTLRLSFDVPKDIDPANEFAILVKVIDDDEDFCNEEFIMLDLDREKHDVMISKLDIEEDHFACGDNIGVKVKVNNIGTKDEDVFIRLESSELGFFEETEEFELEEYDEDDEESRNFYMKMPDYIEAGEYTVRATVFFDDADENHEVEGTVVLFECEKEEGLSSQEIGAQSVEGDKSQATEKKESDITQTQLWKIFLALAIMLFTFFIVLALVAIYHIKHNKGPAIVRGRRDVVMY